MHRSEEWKCLQRGHSSSRDLGWDGDKPSANCRLFVNEECVTRFVIVPPWTCIEFYLEREVKLETDGTRELSGEKYKKHGYASWAALFAWKYISWAGTIGILLRLESYALLIFVRLCLSFTQCGAEYYTLWSHICVAWWFTILQLSVSFLTVRGRWEWIKLFERCCIEASCKRI
jgi:hypothetical protein